MHRACIDRACVALRDEIIFAVRAGIGVSATMATIMIIPVVVIMMSMVVMSYDRYWSYPPLRGLASVSLLKVSARVGRLISNGVLALGFLAIEQPVERYEDKRDIPAVNVGLDEAEEEA